MTASRQHHLLWILALLSMSLLTGCQSQQHVRDADRYMRLRDYPSAVAHYQEAMRLKPSLSQDPAFMGSLHDAQRENALDVSNTLLASDQPENAVDALQAGLRDVPADPTLLSALTAARHITAETMLRRARAAADLGQLDVARVRLEQGLHYEPRHAACLSALQSLNHPAAVPGAGAVQEAHAAARQTMADRHWERAAEQLGSLIVQSPDYLPARADAFAASQQIAQVRSHLAAAQRASSDKQLDAAIGELRLGLNIWPEHSASLALMSDVVARRTRAVELAAAAADALAGKQYDQAIASAESSLAVFPAFADARQVDALARTTAANQAVAAGIAARDKGDYPAANAAFSRALGYLPQMPDAQTGLASVAAAQADAAMSAGHIGLSLLFRMQAADLSPTPAHRRAVDTIRQTIVAKGAFALMIDGHHSDARVAADTVPFTDELLRLLRRQAPASLAINPMPLPTDRPVFHASVAVVQSQVTQAMTSQQQLSQSFAVTMPVINDRIPALRHQVQWADEEYDRLKDRTDKRAELLRDYKNSHDPASPDYQNNVNALQRSLNEGKHDSDEAKRNLRRAENELDDAPHWVAAQRIQQWPYIRRHFTQTASVVVSIAMTDGENHALVAPIGIRRDVIAGDDTTLQPNPAIGVPEDALSLPSPADMQQQVIDESAAEAAGKLLDAAIRARAANLQSQADTLRQAGHADQALELDIAAALICEPLDPQAAAHRLMELRKQAMPPAR